MVLVVHCNAKQGVCSTKESSSRHAETAGTHVCVKISCSNSMVYGDQYALDSMNQGCAESHPASLEVHSIRKYLDLRAKHHAESYRRDLAKKRCSRCVAAPPNYPLRDPKNHLIETIRPLMEIHWV